MPAAARAPARAPAAARGGAAATQDPRFKKLIADLKKGAARTKQHPPAAKKAAEAQAAAKGPANEKLASAKAKQVDKMGEAEGKKPEKSGFLALLRAEIEKVMPRNLEDATKFMKGGEKEQIKSAASGNVAEQKQAAAGPVESAAKAPPNAAGEPAKESTPIPGEPATPLPSVNTANAVPLPKPAEQVSQEQSKKDADQALKDAEVTPDQLKKANDPRFSAVLTAKSSVEQVADASPAKYRAGEKAALAQGIAKATGDARKGVSAIGGVKAGSQTTVKSKQDLAKEKDEAERKKVTDKIESIYNATKAAVEAKLSTLETDVTTKFDRGIDAALASMQRYANTEIDKFYDERYGGIDGPALWLVDKFRDTPPGVKAVLAKARKRFTEEMDALAVSISGIVDKRLADAKAEVAKGQAEVDTYVKSLPKSLQSVGKAAAEAVAERFKELEAGIDEKANDLAQKLAQKYKEAHDKADAELKKIEEENKGAFKKLADKLDEVVKALMEFKAKLMAVIRKGEEAIKMILKDPIGFLGNLLAAIKQGFQKFVGNILAHLKKGFMEWLFGTLTSAGVQIPSDLSLPSILKLVLGVLGITYDRMRAKAVKLIGERNVKIIEKLVEYITKLVQGGPAALWEQVKADLSDLKAMVIDAIQTWLIETVVKQAVAKVVSMFNPVGAIVQAVITIYNVVMFIVERASQIMALVEAVVNSVHAIASGAIGGAANWIEQALARMIPVAIGLLARLIGLGGISDKIKGFIQKVQAKVDKAIDKAIAKIVDVVKKLFGRGQGATQAAPRADNRDQGAPTARPRLVAPVRIGPQHHEVIFEPSGDDVSVKIASGTPLPATTVFAGAMAKIDNWRKYIASIQDPKAKLLFEPILERLNAFHGQQVSRFQAVYNKYHPRGRDPQPLEPHKRKPAWGDVTALQKEVEAELGEISKLVAALPPAALQGLAPADFEALAMKEGERIWKEAWKQKKDAIDKALAGEALEGVQVNYRGSAMKGERGIHKGMVRFDPEDFDVDMYVVHPGLYREITDRAGQYKVIPSQPGMIRPGESKHRGLQDLSNRCSKKIDAIGTGRPNKSYVVIRDKRPVG